MRTFIFIITVCQLLVAFVVTMAIGWSHADVRNMWPVVLVFWTILSAAYALVFVALISNSPMQDWRVAAAWNGVIVTLLIIYSALFYGLSVDWIGISEETVRAGSGTKIFVALLVGLAGPALLRLALFTRGNRR
jgi:hypothetical protein